MAKLTPMHADDASVTNAIKELGELLLASSAGLGNRTGDEIVNTDIKFYEESGFKVGIAQVEVSNFSELGGRLSDINDALQKLVDMQKLGLAVLMVTDVVRGNSRLIAVGMPADRDGTAVCTPGRRDARRAGDDVSQEATASGGAGGAGAGGLASNSGRAHIHDAPITPDFSRQLRIDKGDWLEYNLLASIKTQVLRRYFEATHLKRYNEPISATDRHGRWIVRNVNRQSCVSIVANPSPKGTISIARIASQSVFTIGNFANSRL